MIGAVIVGLIVGVLAKLVHPGRDNMGIILTILLGIGGAVVATYLGQMLGLYAQGQSAGLIGSVIGAVLILAVYGQVRGSSPSA